MNDPISEAIIETLEGGNAQSVLKLISANVWNRIEFARNRKGLKIFETTVTQDILHFIMAIAPHSRVGINLFEAKSEKANGNDIECFIETKKGFILLPMQAKIIYDNFKYPQIDHQVGKSEQIDLLIEYSKKKQGHPLYLLYNYHTDKALLNKIETENKIDYRCYGISYLDAFYLKENYFQKKVNKKGEKTWIIPSFKELHPKVAKPFFQILNKNGLSGNGQNFIRENLCVYNPNLNLKLYTRDEVLYDEDWIDLLGSTRLPVEKEIKYNNHNYIDLSDVFPEFNESGFNPKFRIVFLLKKSKTPMVLIREVD
jgi:hypothetical protein